jgi:hypothetical protein
MNLYTVINIVILFKNSSYLSYREFILLYFYLTINLFVLYSVHIRTYMHINIFKQMLKWLLLHHGPFFLKAGIFLREFIDSHHV